jgi:hypothetical protein
MGSGEADVSHLKITATNKTADSNFYPVKDYDPNWYIPSTTANYIYSYTYPVYKYQVRCPKRGCRQYNWLELEKITPCYNCGAKLKAVTEEPDFVIPVHQ